MKDFNYMIYSHLKESEEIFKKELNKKVNESSDPSQKDKDFYFDVYGSLHKFVESTKDYKVKKIFFSKITSPLFNLLKSFLFMKFLLG